MILACADGLTSADVARRNDTSPQAIDKWHRRFLALGVQGLYHELRPGRPETYDGESIA